MNRGGLVRLDEKIMKDFFSFTGNHLKNAPSLISGRVGEVKHQISCISHFCNNYKKITFTARRSSIIKSKVDH